ncbi:sulfotransferase [Thalassobaculum fulvum]|uniref:sulfotransferase n=1 Tax=Thalassobaculum fulvum TaxID=1633335 RepID=UPI00167859C8
MVGAGYGRTGTASLKLALEQLGFGPCHHMSEVRGSRANSSTGRRPPSARLSTGTSQR